jgi:hypothetical protein
MFGMMLAAAMSMNAAGTGPDANALVVTAANGRLMVSRPGFEATADRIEMNQAKMTIDLVGREGAPATISAVIPATGEKREIHKAQRIKLQLAEPGKSY